MTVRNLLFGLLASGAVVACTPKVADAPNEAPADEAQPAASETDGEDLCKAAEYASLIGTNAAAVTLPADLPHRIYKLGDPVTMDYRPDRLNIVTDADGVITEMKCG